MAFACIFVPDFPAQALERVEPELRAQPLAVLEGKPPLEKIFAVNDKARHAGLDPGITKLQIEACTGLALRPRSPAQEAAAHAALLDCAQSLSPVVEDTAGDTIVLDLAGLESLFGALPAIARELAHRTGLLGLEANVAVASNPDAAALAARGFPGVTVIPVGKEADRLGGLPLETLFAGRQAGAAPEVDAVIQTLDRWGLRNLRAFAALPEVSIAERLGQYGVGLHRLARGAVQRTLAPLDPPCVFEEAVELEFPLVLLEPLAFLLHRMLEQICARLGLRAFATQELRLHLELENKQSFSRTLHLPVPMLDAKVFLKLLQLDLKAHPPGAPIMKVHLQAEPARQRAGQSGLFLPLSPEPEKLELTLARISAIVGEGKAGALEMLDTHRPEGFRIQHFAPPEPQPGRAPGQVTEMNSRKNGPVTALRRFRPALRVRVQLRAGQPARLACPQRKEVEGEVVWSAGPWRSSGDWWQHPGWAREEWDVALKTGAGLALYRLVRDVLSGGWFVEGSYD
jgi:protein ImuB